MVSLELLILPVLIVTKILNSIFMKTHIGKLFLLFIVLFIISCGQTSITKLFFEKDWKMVNFNSKDSTSIETFFIAMAVNTNSNKVFEFSDKNIIIKDSLGNEINKLPCKWDSNMENLVVSVNNLKEEYNVSFNNIKNELLLTDKNGAITIYTEAKKK
jgi:hypothetical protein